MKLALDHHYSHLIAQRLRAKGHDVAAAVELGWDAMDDEALLALCVEERRAVLTNNVADFAAIARRWQAEGRAHWGLIFSSDASWPRTRNTIGRYVTALDGLMRKHPALESFVDRVHWLS